MSQRWAVILAAGEGKRMNSTLPKVLHPICGKAMLRYVIDSAVEISYQVVIVIGHEAAQIKKEIGPKYNYVIQEKQLGTGHALMQALQNMPQTGQILVLSGDIPLLKSFILKEFISQSSAYKASLVTTILQDPTGYGRVVRGEDMSVRQVVEESDATVKEKEIKEINTGIYYFDLGLLNKYLPLLSPDNRQGEYYLPDLFAMMQQDGDPVGAYVLNDYRAGLGINNRYQLAEATAIIRGEINRELMLSGVTMIDPDNTYIDHGVTIGKDTVIYPNTLIKGNSIIGSSCSIGPGVFIENSIIADNVKIMYARIVNNKVNANEIVDPFANLG